MSKKYVVKGINDEASQCSVCGRQELRRVVWLTECDCDGNELNNPFPVGTSCAARMLSWSHPTSEKTKARVILAALTAQAESIIRDFWNAYRELQASAVDIVKNEYGQEECFVTVEQEKVQVVSFERHFFTNEKRYLSHDELKAIAKSTYLSNRFKKELRPKYQDAKQWFFLQSECVRLSEGRLKL